MPIRKEILDMLVCPQCKDNLTIAEEKNGLICKKCKLLYPVKESILVMLVEEAVKIST